MARNHNAQSMFPYSSGDHSQQTNQHHHGNFMNGSSNDYNNLNYSDTNNSDHNSQKHFNDRMFNYNSNSNYNQNNSFFSNSNSSSNDQFWGKRGNQHNNYNYKDDQNSGFSNRNEQSVNKLSSNLNQMSVTDKSINKLTNKNAKQQTTTSSKTMSWASIASQPAKAQPKSFKSKLATVVLSSTSTTKHVPPPMPPVAQISLDEIEPIPNPWANKNNNQKSSKDEQLNNDLDNAPLNRQHQQDNYRKDGSINNSNRDYNVQHDQPNHKSYGNRSQDNERFNDQQYRSQYNRFDQQQNNNNNRFNNNQNSGRNNSLNNSHNSYSSRNENMRDNNYHQQRDNFNQQQPQNYHNNNYNSRGNYNNSNYYNNQNNNYHNNKHSNQRSQYQQSQQNNQFQNKNQNQRFNTGQHMQQKNQLPSPQYANKQSQQMQSLPQLTEQQQIQQEKEAKELLDKLNAENNYNPSRFDLDTKNAKYFIIKSYSEDDIHRSIKYSIWCSTEHGNIKLDNAFREQRNIGPIYLFYSVNGSGHFCGIAEMISPVDYNASSGIWAQDKWKGQFKVKWIYVKDVPNNELRHIVLENNDFKPVTNSRDTQEVPPEKGKAVLNVIHSHKHKTSIFDDFFHYERKQYEELLASKRFDSPTSSSSINQQQIGSNQFNKNNQFNKQQQNDNKKDTSPDSSHNLNNSNNSKGSILSSNYEPSNMKKSWAEECD